MSILNETYYTYVVGRIKIFWGGFVVRYITTNLGHDLDVIKHFSVSPKKDLNST